MRLAFMGTPDFAVPTLDALIDAGHDVAAVYCQPPRPAGRGNSPQVSAVQRRAGALGLAVRTPISLRDPAEQAKFVELDLEAAVVAAYGLILPEPILAASGRGCLNVHGSLLPRWRGAAPIQRAILAGDVETGVTIMQMERGLDTGPMLAVERTPVGRKTAGALTAEIAALGARLMVRVLAHPGAFPPLRQPEEGATYAAKIEKAEARLDFHRPAAEVLRSVHAFNPTPGAFFEAGGERIKLLEAHVVGRGAPPGVVLDGQLTIGCGQDALRPLLVQRAGRAAMSPTDLLRGFPIHPGTLLG